MARRTRSFLFDNISKRLVQNTNKTAKEINTRKAANTTANTDILTKAEVETVISNTSIATLSDTTVANVANEQVLQYNANTAKWENETLDLSAYATNTDLADYSNTAQMNTAIAASNTAMKSYVDSEVANVDFSAYSTTTQMNTAIASSNTAMKNYVDAEVAGIVNSAPAALDTLNELAAALGDDANFSTTTSTALGNRLRIDVNNQGLNATQLTNARTNLGLGTAATTASTDYATAAQGTKADTAHGWGNHASAGYGTSNFSGAYADLTGKPTIPTNNNQLTNGAGYITLNTSGNLNVTGNITGTTGLVSGQTGARYPIKVYSNQWPEVQFFRGSTEELRIGAAETASSYNTAAGDFYVFDVGTGKVNLIVPSNGGSFKRNNGAYTVWDSGNDGASSGLDADLLDGQHGSYYSNYNNLSNKPTIPTNNNQLTNGAGYLTSNVSTNIDMNNYAITNLNDLTFNDPGPNEGIKWLGGSDWRIYESPDNLTTNSGGNLQFVTGTTRRMTLNTAGALYLSDAIQTSRYENASGTFMFRWGTNTGTSGIVNFSDSTSDPSTSAVSGAARGITWGQRTDNNPYYIIYPYYYSNGLSSHTRLRISWHTGVEIGGSSAYGGTRFFNDAPFTGAEIMSVGKGDGHVRVTNNLYIGGNLAWHAGNLTNNNQLTNGAGYITNGSNYNVNDPWLRENGDNADVKLYGNSRQMTFRTDGVSGGTGGHTGYPFRWTYGGNASGNTEMLLNTSGQLWLANYGWLHDAFLRKNATDTQTNTINMNGYFVGGADGHRDKGVFGNYNSYRINHVWSMGTSYRVGTDGLSFGNLYGFAYTYHNRVYTSNSMGGYHQIVWCENGTPRCALGRNVWTSGNVTAYSDIRVKENLERIPDALEKVKKLNGYTFDRTDIETDNEGNTARKRQTGVVAQEVLEVLPEVVTGNEENPDGHLSVAYGNMVGLLIEAIKEQQEQIEELKARLQ